MSNSLFSDDHFKNEEAQIQEVAEGNDAEAEDEQAEASKSDDSGNEDPAEEQTDVAEPKSSYNRVGKQYRSQFNRFRSGNRFMDAPNVPALSQQTQQTISKLGIIPFVL